MAERKNPTNQDIIRKLDTMSTRIGALEAWKIAEDSAKKAVAEYRHSEQETRTNKATLTEKELQIKVWKQVGVLLGIAIAIAYAYIAAKGIHL